MDQEREIGTLTMQVEQVLLDNDERYHNLILSVPAALYTTDCNGVITLFNDEAAALWGRRPEIGKDLWCGSWKIFNSQNGSEMALDECPMAVALREKRPVRGEEILIERPDGTKAWVQPFPTPLYDKAGRMIGALNLLVDVSERKKWEKSLQEANRSLEERVLDRTAEIEALCYSIAHDLRQHIRGININARMIADSLTDSEENTTASIGRLTSAATQMDRLVSAMLGYARISRDEMVMDRVDISRVALETAADASSQYPRVEFRVQPGMAIEGDPSLTNIVIGNLIDNACKYSQRASEPRVEIGMAEGAIFVRDNGIGFDMEYAERIFMPFQRLHREAEFPGTGIGLASVRRIVQRHGGKMWTKSAPGAGATFSVVFGQDT